MEKLLNKVVLLSESSGQHIEGVLRGFVSSPTGLRQLELEKPRFINWKDEREESKHQNTEYWETGTVYVNEHTISWIHESHFVDDFRR